MRPCRKVSPSTDSRHRQLLIALPSSPLPCSLSNSNTHPHINNVAGVFTIADSWHVLSKYVKVREGGGSDCDKTQAHSGLINRCPSSGLLSTSDILSCSWPPSGLILSVVLVGDGTVTKTESVLSVVSSLVSITIGSVRRVRCTVCPQTAQHHWLVNFMLVLFSHFDYNEINIHTSTLCQNNDPTLKLCSSNDFDDIWQKYSKESTLCSEKKQQLTFSFISLWIICGFKQKLQWIYPRIDRFWQCLDIHCDRWRNYDVTFVFLKLERVYSTQ